MGLQRTRLRPEVKQLVTKNEFNRFPIRNQSARPSCLPNTFLRPSFAPGRDRRVSLGGGSVSSHVTEEKRTGLQPGISPLCGTAIPGCAPIFIFSSALVAAGFRAVFFLFVGQPLLAVLRSSSSRLLS